MQLDLLPAPPTLKPKPPVSAKRSLCADYTDFARCGVLSNWLYLPPLTLAEALERFLRDLGRYPDQVALIAAKAEREPPCLHGALIMVSAGKDEGRWPLAYLIGDPYPVPLDEALAAFKQIGGRP